MPEFTPDEQAYYDQVCTILAKKKMSRKPSLDDIQEGIEMELTPKELAEELIEEWNDQ